MTLFQDGQADPLVSGSVLHQAKKEQEVKSTPQLLIGIQSSLNLAQHLLTELGQRSPEILQFIEETFLLDQHLDAFNQANTPFPSERHGLQATLSRLCRTMNSVLEQADAHD